MMSTFKFRSLVGLACVFALTADGSADDLVATAPADEATIEAAAVEVEAAAEAAAEAVADVKEAVEGAREEAAVEVVRDAVAVDIAVAAAPDMQLAVPAGDEQAQLVPYLAMFRPILKTELSFAHRVCEFTDEQKAKAIEAGKAQLLEFARQYLQGQNQPQLRGFFLFGVGAAAPAQPMQVSDPRGAFEAEVAKIVHGIVDDKQREIYDAELKQRADFHKDAALENVVSKIDAKLLLSPQQRTQLAESLRQNWDGGWAPQLDALINMGDYLPQIPDDHVVGVLSAEQKSVWDGIQKVSFGSFFGNDQNWIAGAKQLDDFDLGDEAPAMPE